MLISTQGIMDIATLFFKLLLMWRISFAIIEVITIVIKKAINGGFEFDRIERDKAREELKVMKEKKSAVSNYKSCKMGFTSTIIDKEL